MSTLFGNLYVLGILIHVRTVEIVLYRRRTISSSYSPDGSAAAAYANTAVQFNFYCVLVSRRLDLHINSLNTVQQ